MSEAAQRETIAFLADPASHGGQAVEAITTHASIVFLVGDRVLKLKRAVKYSYLDFSTPELRRQYCETELALNRRTAPQLYLQVLPVTRETDGRLALGGAGAPLDWLVVMKRFPQEALFSRLAEADGLTPDLMRRLADNIAAFHASAEVRPDFGGVGGVTQVIGINSENLRRDGPPRIDLAEIDALTEASRAAEAELATLLERRREKGHTRRCHGDLHLGNICLIDGAPTLFDCIEFNASIASTDVLYDLAFLLMDLRYRGHATEAAIVLNRYLDVTEESDGLPAMPLFLSLRAWVRAHVTATAATLESSAERREADLAVVRRYFDLAMHFLKPRPPRLLAIGGLSGTGKSTVAAVAAGVVDTAPAARVLRSDVVRKRQFGAAPEQKLPAEAYGEAATARVYAVLLEEAAAALKAGRSVILDSVAAKPEERASFADLARRLRVPFDGIWLEAPAEVLMGRVGARHGDASDADLAILRKQLGYDLGPMDWRRVDASPSPEAVAQAVLKAVTR
ncbi:MAG TPA: AAA family ATPase [Candidatus Binatia bacterium]|nr:AAA family ATPase [Candidatus Binatia bacterium]